jgi:hypothetical protein
MPSTDVLGEGPLQKGGALEGGSLLKIFRNRPAFKKARAHRTDRQPDHQERNEGSPHLYPLQTRLRNSRSNLFLSC